MESRPHETPGDLHGYCGGRDQIDPECTCPDIELRTRVNKPYMTTWWCACCANPLRRDQLIRNHPRPAQITPPEEA